MTEAPDYYRQSRYGKQTIDVIEERYGSAMTYGFCVGNQTKYLERAGKKIAFTADEICEMFGIEPYELCDKCKEAFGEYPVDYCKGKDLEKAKWYEEKAKQLLEEHDGEFRVWG